MPFLLELPPPWRERGWKLKIRDRERAEVPHVTVLYKRTAWRFGLRTPGPLDSEPDPTLVPAEILSEIDTHLDELRAAWDQMYPENPITSDEDDDG